MNDEIRQKKLKIVQAFDEGKISKEEALELSGRLDSGGSAVFRKEREIIEEQHPDLSTLDRGLFKNFSLNSEQGVEKLRELYPEHNITWKNGDVVMRAPGEEAWRKLEPNNMGFDYSGKGGLLEFGKDVMDVGYDAPAAALETLATIGGGTAGALGGTATMGPGPGTAVGALGGGMAAGGAAGVGTETLRQKIGNLTGFAEGYDPDQIKMSGAFGAASPLMFGTGATVKGIAKQLAKKKAYQGMSQEAIDKAAEKIARSQRSLITRGVGNASMWASNRIGSWASGYTPKALKELRTQIDRGLMTMNPAEIPRGFKADLDGAMDAKGAILKKAYGESLEALDVAVDTKKLEQPLWDLLAQYEKKAERVVPGFKQKAKQADEGVALLGADGKPLAAAEEAAAASRKDLQKAEVQDYYYLKDLLENNLEPDKVLEGRTLVDYLDKLNDMTNIRKNPGEISPKLSTIEKDIQRVSRTVADDLNKGMDQTVAGEAFLNVKNQYKDFMDDKAVVKRYLKDDKAAESALRNFGSDKQVIRQDDLMRLKDRYGVDVEEYANQMYIMSEFLNPSLAPKYVGGTSPMQRAVPLALGAGALGWYGGQQTGMSPYLTSAASFAAGSALGSPRTIKLLTQGGSLGRKGINQTRRLQPAPQMGVNVWEQMQQRN